MRRATLLRADPAELPKGTRRKGRIILTGQIMTVDHNRILEADLWVNGELRVRHFVGRKSRWNYDVRSTRWDSRRLGNLFGWGEYATKRHAGYPDEETEEFRKAAKIFFGKELRQAVRIEINSYEWGIECQKSARAAKRRLARLTKEVRETTPPLPRNFMRFVRKNAPKGKKAIGIQIFQKCKNGMFVERHFRVCREGDGLHITEEVNGYAAKPGGWWKDWKYGVYHNSYGRRQEWWGSKSGSAVRQIMRKLVLFTGNLHELGFSAEQMQTIKRLADLNVPTDWSYQIGKVIKGTPMRYMLDKGLINLTKDFLNGTGGYEVAPEAESLEKYLQITPQKMAYLREVDGSWRSVRMLQNDKAGILRAATLLMLEKAVTPRSIWEWDYITKNNLPIRHIIALLGDKRGGVKTAVMSKYRDYLQMAQELGNNIHDEIIYRNKNWEMWHDRYAEELNRRREEKEAKRRETEFKAIRTQYKKNCALFSWEDGGYCIEVPRDYTDIIKEGREQHHCVGATDLYMNRMAKRKSFILFLRRTGDKETPYYTIEATTTQVIQAYAAYDRQPDWETVKPILDRWMTQVKKNARKLEKGAKK